jgi:hypothetical protein
MPRPALPRRSKTEWAVRGGLAALVAVTGYCSATYSLAQAVSEQNVVRAHDLAPGDGVITARLAASLAGPEATSADRARSDQLARQALRQDPTAVVAVSTLGLNAQARDDSAGARRIFAYAEKLSRRNLPTQLWAIEDAVARGDVPDALRHYDVTLRTTPKAADILYPVLASASADPAIRQALARTLLARPAWSNEFTNFLSVNSPDAAGTAQLFTQLRRNGVAVQAFANAGVINKLVTNGQAEAAWSYYSAITKGADRLKSRDPQFTGDLDTPSLFDWILPKNDAVNASIQRGDGGGIFDFSGPSSVGGPLLQQTQMLTPGDYQITGHSIGIDQVEGARPYWALLCQDNREIGRVVLPNSSEQNGNFAGRFTVPQQCPAQTLVLVARPSDKIDGINGQIDRVQLAPAR